MRLLVLVAMFAGIAALVWWAVGTDDPSATITAISTAIVVGMAVLLVVTIVIDGKHFAQGHPHPAFLPISLLGQGLALASSLSTGFVGLTVAMLLAIAATIVVAVRIRRNTPPAAEA